MHKHPKNVLKNNNVGDLTFPISKHIINGHTYLGYMVLTLEQNKFSGTEHTPLSVPCVYKEFNRIKVAFQVFKERINHLA